MISHKKANILTVTSGLILHGCNAQGVMGSGVAKQLRARYPEIYSAYLAHLKEFYPRNCALGSVNVVEVLPGLYVGNLISQENYGRDSSIRYVSYDAIVDGIEDLKLQYSGPVHIPYLIGAGLGGGSKPIIEAIIEASHLDNIIYYHLD